MHIVQVVEHAAGGDLVRLASEGVWVRREGGGGALWWQTRHWWRWVPHLRGVSPASDSPLCNVGERKRCALRGRPPFEALDLREQRRDLRGAVVRGVCREARPVLRGGELGARPRHLVLCARLLLGERRERRGDGVVRGAHVVEAPPLHLRVHRPRLENAHRLVVLVPLHTAVALRSTRSTPLSTTTDSACTAGMGEERQQTV